MKGDYFPFVKKTIFDQLTENVNKNRDAMAYIFPTKNFSSSYGSLYQDALLVAKSLLSLGFGYDSKIAVWSTNTYECVTLIFACSAIGAIIVPLNTNYRDYELKYTITHSDSEAVFCIKSYRKNDFEEAIHKLNFKNIFIMNTEKNKYYPNWDDFIALGNSISDNELTNALDNVTSSDTFCLQFTSGTTGNPKGALLSNFSALNVGMQFARMLNLNSKDIMITPLPLFHCFGIIDVLLSSLCSMTPLVLIDYFSPIKVLSAIEKYKCTTAIAVPTMFVAMYQHPDFLNYDVTTIDKGIIGGSVCIPKVVEEITQNFQMTGLAVGYGATETCAFALASHNTDSQYERMYTCGKILDNMEFKIINNDTGLECLVNQPGELLIRGYNLMKGYYKDPIDTAKAIDKEGWYHTGDMAILEPFDTVRIIGRYKDIIIRGGENISPSEIEEHLLTIEGVKSAEVIGVRDKKYGEEIAAFLIVDNCKLSDSEIKNYIKERLARYKTPKYILYTDSFPTTASGKIQKYKLTQLAEKLLSLHDLY